MPTKHARCSASAAHRWINCPGSVALSDQCPDPGSSSYADEGTVAHNLAELKLRHVLHEITDAQYKHGANSHLRQKGKVAVLACGYQGGVGAMKRMDKGGSIPEDELQSVVDQWRQANSNSVKLWRTCELAARTAIEEHRTVRLKNGIAFGYINGNLFIKLPGGRKLPSKEDSDGTYHYTLGNGQHDH